MGNTLQKCTDNTGFYRDGLCRTGPNDTGRHVVCAKVDDKFLEYTKSRGNNLSSPGPNFKGLKDGDKWCLCASRWEEARKAGVAPPVDIDATSESALAYVSKDNLLGNNL